jgi:hypothetical protein
MKFTSNEQILICIIIGMSIIIIFLLYNKSEGFNSIFATEAINNIASMYNKDTLTATNINTAGINVRDPSTGARFFYTDPTGRSGSGPQLVIPAFLNTSNIVTTSLTADNIKSNGYVEAGSFNTLGPVKAGCIDASEIWVNGQKIA